MKVNLADNQKENSIDCCHYLGLKDDAETYSAYPSRWNVCFHTNPPETPILRHQRSFCLDCAHTQCPIFQSDVVDKMPKHLRIKRSKNFFKNKKVLRVGGLTLAGLLALIFLLFNQRFLSFVGITKLFTKTPTSQVSAYATAEPLLSWRSTTEAVIETVITATASVPVISETPVTPSPTEFDPVLALDTPIGDQHKFIIHRVTSGESLQNFADTHQTSIEAILSVNYNLITPLWVDWLIIIPVNNSDVGNLPAFDAYQVEEAEITIEALSEKLLVSNDAMLLYNNLDTGHVLHEGEWLLVPHEKPAP